MIVIDTNVLSELMRPDPSGIVKRWIAARPPASIFVTTPTQAEILFGLAILPDGRRREGLLALANRMFATLFAGRVLAFDVPAATEFATIAAGRRRLGRPIAIVDCQIVAIARSRGGAVATRNVADFGGCGVTILNPWQDP